MNPAWSVWAVPAVLAVLLLAALIAAFVFWRRARKLTPAIAVLPDDTAQLQRPLFDAAMRVLYPRDGAGRYDKPCVLVCGPGGAGKTDLLRGAGLSPVTAEGGIDSGWWRGTEGVAFELPGAAWDADGGPWHAFLRLLDRQRGRRALDALVWLIPVDALAAGNAGGERLYRKFSDIQDRLGLSLPVYVVVGACDRIDGFAQWASEMNEGARLQSLGWSNPAALGNAWRAALAESGVATLGERLRRLVGLASLRRAPGADAARIFTMPDRLAAALAELPQALQQAMRQNAVMTPFELRGIYLSGRAAETVQTTPVSDVFADAPALPPAPAPAFARDLFAERVFGEFGLARLVPRRVAAERRTRRAVLAGCALLSLLWLVALGPSWYAVHAQMTAMRTPLLAMRSAQGAGPGEHSHIDADSTRAIVTAMEAIQDWNTRTLTMPLSWWRWTGGLDGAITEALRDYYQNVLFGNIDHALAERAEALNVREGRPARQAADLAAAPEQMAPFTRLRNFVDATLTLEHYRARFRDLVAEHSGSWKEATDLLAYLFELRLDGGSPRTAARFDAALQAGTYTIAAQDDSQSFRATLLALHNDWIESMFGDTRLALLERELATTLRGLDSTGPGRDAALDQLRRRIGEMRTLLARTDLAWLADGKLVASTPYRKLMADVGQSRLLGNGAAAQMQRDMAARQEAFRNNVEEDAAGDQPVLAYAEGKELAVAADLAALEQSIGHLLLHRFAQGAGAAAPVVPPPAGQLVAWNADKLGAARDTVADLQAYEAGDLAKAPPAYQGALRQLARLQAADLIDQQLGAAVAPADCEQPWRCTGFDDARQILGPLFGTLIQLEMRAPATRWQAVMDHQAEAILAALSDQAEHSTLYLPPVAALASWNGDPASALRPYGMQAPADAQAYLADQLGSAAEWAEASKAPRLWLAQARARAGTRAQALAASWGRFDAELGKHAAKLPGGSVARLEQWIGTDLAALDSANCDAMLARSVGARQDFFQRRLATVAAAYRPRCAQLASSALRSAYGTLASHFNQHLLGRFPFSSAPDAAPADPEQVKRLLALMAERLAPARAVLTRRKDAQSQAALAFLNRLAALQPMLAAVTADDAGGAAALDVWPEWRVNRSREKGAEQVFELRLDAGDVLPAPLPGAAPGVAWRLGEPVVLSLRWAANSAVVPIPDAARPAITVRGRTASWRYDDPWSLLRLLAEQAAPASDLSERDANAPNVLRLVVRTRDTAGLAGEMVAYVRLAVSVHGKPERLAWSSAPASAAPSLERALPVMTVSDTGAVQ